MAEKYIQYNNNGSHEEIEGTVTSSGVSEAGKIVALDTDGRLNSSVMPTGIGADTKTVVASENLAAGDVVNIHDSGGAKVRKADATGGVAKKVDGFVLSSVTSGQNALVYFEGTISGLTGLTIGGRYFLNTTAGGVTITPITTATYISQYVGKAISATEISFEPSEPVIRA